MMIFRNGVFLLIFGLSLPLGVYAEFSSRLHTQCKYIPGDQGFPEKHMWDKLNATVSGRLVATAPVARVCHEQDYNEAQCNSLKQEWDFPQPQLVAYHFFESARGSH